MVRDSNRFTDLQIQWDYWLGWAVFFFIFLLILAFFSIFFAIVWVRSRQQ